MKNAMKIIMAALAFFALSFQGMAMLTEEAALVTTCMPTKELYFQNRSLLDVGDLAITGFQKFGGSTDTRAYRWTAGPLGPNVGTFSDSGLYLYANDGSTLTVEFHGRTYGHSYGGVGNGFELKLTQEGTDIHGQITWAAGFTGADPIFTSTWAGKADSGRLRDYNSQTATYSAGGTNLKLYFSDARLTARTVTFVDKNNDIIDTYVVPIGEYAAVAPTPPVFEGYVFHAWNAEFTHVKADMTVAALYHKLCTVTFYGKDKGSVLDTQIVEETYAATNLSEKVPPISIPEVAGYVFYQWDVDFSNVTNDLDVTALYHRLYTVTFVDADGTTVLDTQSVEETTAAPAPDMTGRTYGGEPFVGWDVDFSNILGDLTVTAVYGVVPDYVQAAMASGILPSDVLIWSGGAAGIWDDASENWRNIDGMKRTWTPGATAAFSISTAISVSGAKSIGKIIALNDAAAVTFSGDTIDFAGSATARFAINSTIRFNNNVGGTGGFVQVADTNITALTEFAGDYSSQGRFAVSNGTIRIVGAGTMFGGNMTASGSSVTNPIYVGKDCRIEFDSTSAQTFATLLNATNAGSGYSTMKTSPTTGRFVIGPNALNVTFKCTSADMHRFYNAIDVYGTVSVAPGTYHLLEGNSYGIFVHPGGVLNLDTGYYEYGHRGTRHTCYAGGVINFNAVQSMGASDNTLTLEGGEARLNADYTADLTKDNAHNNIIMKSGAKMTGAMMTMGWNRTTGNTFTVGGTNACSITLGKIRFGQSAITAASGKTMLATFDIADVTGDASADLAVSSEFYVNTGAVWTPATAAWLGFVKKGAGTMLLTGVSTNFGGSVTLNAGTLALGSAAKLAGAALAVTGDASLDVAPGGRMAFADSSGMAWTAGKTLTVSGDLDMKTIRFGTDAGGLTAAQLDQIKKPGSTALAWLSDQGYLRIGQSPTVFLMK